MEKKIGKNWESMKTHVKCPYYVTHSFPRKGSHCTVVCEKLPTIAADCTMVLEFRTRADRDKHMEHFCMNKYYRCPVFRSITWELMEEEEDG